MAGACQPRIPLLCRGLLAAILALNIDAMRLDGGAGAVSSDGSMVAGLASKPSFPLGLDSAAARAQRDRDLRAAADYLDSINFEDYLHLGNVKDTLERLEDIRERVLSFGTARDPRRRLQIRNILRDVREQSEAFKVLAAKLEAEGQVDDGGDELPTQRDNICSRISKYHVEVGFLELVHLFCQSLDAVRKAVNAGEDEEPMAYSVSGMLNNMAMAMDYRQGVGWEIERVLGEERRWIAKHLAPRQAGIGSALFLPEGGRTRFRRWPLSVWETHIWEDIEVDSAELPFKALKKANDVLMNATAEADLSISSARTRIQRIVICKERLAQYISGSDPTFREQVREVLQQMKARIAALRAIVARKLAAGDVDNSSDVLPSQRDNICTKLGASGLEENFREDVLKLCEALDMLHVIVNVTLDKDTCAYEVSGRMTAIERKPGFSDSPVASELEHLLAEELTWRARQGAIDGP